MENKHKKVSRFMRVLAAFLLIFSISTATMIKKPVVVADATAVGGAVFAGVAAGGTCVGIAPVAGGLVVAAALTAAGIGVSALVHGEDYATACQRIWGKLSREAIMGIAVAGTVAQPILGIKKETMVEMIAAYGLVTQQKSAIENVGKLSKSIYTGSATLEEIRVGTGLNILKWNHNYTGVTENFNNFRIVADTALLTTPLTFELTNGNYIVGGHLPNNPNYAGYWLALSASEINNSSNGYAESIYTAGFKNNYLVSFDVVKDSIPYTAYGHLCVTNDAQYGYIGNLTMQLVQAQVKSWSLGEDVINVANRAWYAKEVSALNNRIDELTDRLGEAQGRAAGSGVNVYPPSVTGNPSIDDYDKTRYKSQQDTLKIPPIINDTDRAKNTATNADRDTTAPSNPENPSSGTTSGTTSQIVDAADTRNLVGNIGDGLNSFKDLFGMLGDFFAFLAQAFSYVPPLFWVIVIAALVVVVILRIFGR